MSAAQEGAEPVAQPRRMLDRYEIVAEIARGGMGTVYLARLGGAGGFERLMAIKLMHEHLAEDGNFVAMLLDEARTAANIHHPNAVGIVDVCESPVGYYLVMNYVDGYTFAQLLSHKSVTPAERVRLATRIVADSGHGLHAAHTAKDAKGEKLAIVHRDVSPQNILVGTDGLARIVDFGIALAASRIAASRPGVLKGKPSYMAPEQAKGLACDARADVFALGIVLWESLVGERLFQAEMDIATLIQVMECKVESPNLRNEKIPEALAAVCMKALQKEPEDRFQNARDFAIALERAAEQCGMLANMHEVESTMARLFSSEISLRQQRIKTLLDAPSADAKPLQPGQLGTIPKLVVKRPKTPTGEGELPSGVRIATLATRASTPSAVRTGDASVDPHDHTRASERPDSGSISSSGLSSSGERSIAPSSGGASSAASSSAMASSVASASSAAPTSQRGPSMTLAVGVVIVGMLLAGLAAWFWSSGPTPSPQEPSALAPGEPLADEAALLAPPSDPGPSADELAAEGAPVAVEGLPIGADAPADPALEAVQEPSAPAPTEEVGVSADEERAHRRRPRGGDPAPATERSRTSPETGGGRPGIELETNPYFTH